MTDSTGAATVVGEQRYLWIISSPFRGLRGETRLTTGTIFTDQLFTGQREMAGLGIYHYNARFYSPKLGRFLSADTIVPNPANPQSLNRLSYVRNNPLRYIDPTGHMEWSGDGGGLGGATVIYKPPPGGGGGGNDDDDDGDDATSSLKTLASPAPFMNTNPFSGGVQCPVYDTSCANVSYEELETYLNNNFKFYKGSLWAGAVVLGLLAGVAYGSCGLTFLLGCAIGTLVAAEAVELTYEADEAGDINSYLHTELGNLEPGEETAISLDYTDDDSTFFELNASNTSSGQNIDFPINGTMLQVSIDSWNAVK